MKYMISIMLCFLTTNIHSCPTDCTCNSGRVDCSFKNLIAIPAGIPNSTVLLKLDNNEITTINPGTFDDLTALQELLLYSNQLTSLDPGVFDGLSGLAKLDLSSNKLKSLDPGNFSRLPGLLILKLDSNEFTVLIAGVFEGLLRLQSLSLYNGLVETINSGTFKNLPALDYLDLDTNQLQDLSAGVFDGLAALKTLDLRNNRLTALVLEGLPSLTRLYLDNNPLACKFCALKRLQQYLNTTQVGNAGAVCNGTNTFVLEHDFTNCTDIQEKVEKSKDYTLTPEQIGMIVGIVLGVMVVICSIFMFLRFIWKRHKMRHVGHSDKS